MKDYEINFTREPLNSLTYSIRASQLILQYGVGSMIDMPDQTLMPASPELWKSNATIPIYDERFQKALKVDLFKGFTDDTEKRVSYVRFPEWYFCPSCRRFMTLKKWKEEYQKNNKNCKDTYFKKLVCIYCRVPLVVSRIVTVCSNGHINDFPWIEWVHLKSKKNICSTPSLKILTGSASTEGLESVTVKCESCSAKTTLKGCFNPDGLNDIIVKCKGRHPWKHQKENCTCIPIAKQRGSSTVYYPYVESSLVIPPYSSNMYKLIYEDENYRKCSENIVELNEMFNRLGITDKLESEINNRIETYSDTIAKNTSIPKDKVIEVLTNSFSNSSEENFISTSSVSYRYEEYQSLNGTALFKDNMGDFIREGTQISDYNLPYLKNISLIKRLREVRAQLGFSRIVPVGINESKGQPTNYVDIKVDEKDGKWYPACEAYGEGIFIELDDEIICKWIEGNTSLFKQVSKINKNYQNSYWGNQIEKNISPKFLLLHTLAHLLIRQLSFDCGYNIASLRERIYCSDSSDGVVMSGFLIYTSGGDSEGTLGGLVRQGRSDLFPEVFRKSVESALICSNDPVCSMSSGQGKDGLNLAACYSCTLIPETSCEHYNSFLDRSVLVGNFDDQHFGFFDKQIYNDWASE